MKDYWLAKLVSSVGEVDSRKRLQKAIYLLQLHGSPLACDYILHYYGPYSFELASLIDQLNSAGIIEETPEPLAPGVVRYRSAVTEPGKKALNKFEQSDRGRQLHADIVPFITQFKDLNGKDPWVLELAATVAFEVVPISVEGAMATPGCMLRAPELLGNSLLLAVIL